MKLLLTLDIVPAQLTALDRTWALETHHDHASCVIMTEGRLFSG